MMEQLTFLSPAKDTPMRVLSKEGMYIPDSRLVPSNPYGSPLSREALTQLAPSTGSSYPLRVTVLG